MRYPLSYRVTMSCTNSKGDNKRDAMSVGAQLPKVGSKNRGEISSITYLVKKVFDLSEQSLAWGASDGTTCEEGREGKRGCSLVAFLRRGRKSKGVMEEGCHHVLRETVKKSKRIIYLSLPVHVDVPSQARRRRCCQII